MPNPKIMSSTPSLFISNNRIGESVVSMGKFVAHTSVTFKLLHGSSLMGLLTGLDFDIIQFLSRSKGNGNIDTKITTRTIIPAICTY